MEVRSRQAEVARITASSSNQAQSLNPTVSICHLICLSVSNVSPMVVGAWCARLSVMAERSYGDYPEDFLPTQNVLWAQKVVGVLIKKTERERCRRGGRESERKREREREIESKRELSRLSAHYLIERERWRERERESEIESAQGCRHSNQSNNLLINRERERESERERAQGRRRSNQEREIGSEGEGESERERAHDCRHSIQERGREGEAESERESA